MGSKFKLFSFDPVSAEPPFSCESRQDVEVALALSPGGSPHLQLCLEGTYGCVKATGPPFLLEPSAKALANLPLGLFQVGLCSGCPDDFRALPYLLVNTAFLLSLHPPSLLCQHSSSSLSWPAPRSQKHHTDGF